jgi:transcriptional regulator NrdR family protein
MTCPECGGKIRTIETAQIGTEETYRRKKCTDCGRTMFTIEFEVDADEKYRANLREARPYPYDRDKDKANEYIRNCKAKKKAKMKAEKAAAAGV